MVQIKKIVKLFFFLYLFILSIELIKRMSLFFAPELKDFLLQNLNPIKALSLGWFSTSIVQSSGAVDSVVATFVGNSLLKIPMAVYILMGASIGTTITALIISFIIVSKKRKDFRHGFEIGLCCVIYNVLLISIVFFLEFFFNIFSKSSLFLASLFEEKILISKIPNLVEIITSLLVNPVLNHTNKILILLFAFAGLIISLEFIGKSVIGVFGGQENARKFINKYFESKYTAYLIGIILTGILFSSSITIGLLVPLTVSGLINLRKAIPFIIGAELGTFTDLVLVAFIIGKSSAFAIPISIILFQIIGSLIFLPNTKFLFDATKYTSKKLIKISRKKAFYILVAFIAIPLLLFLIF